MLPADSPFASLPAPGPHPATAELRAYAAGTLNPGDEHRVEAHALDCERCAELLEGFSMSDVATTDQALAGLRTRLQARVADDVTALPVLLPASRPLWPRLAAAAALLGVVAGGIWGWEQQHQATDVATAPHETAAPAAQPKPTSPAAIATAKPPQAAPRPQPEATAPAAASSRPADYAAVRPRRRAAGSHPLGRPEPSCVLVLADEDAATAATSNEVASQDAPAATEAMTPAARAVAPSARKAVAAEVAAPQPVVAAAPPVISRAAADSGATRQQEAIVGQFSKAKTIESAAFVRDKPMPAAMDIAPAPVKGTPALRAYLHQKAAKFELEEGAKPLNGTVRLRFVVGADGQLSNLRVVRSLRPDYDEEALRMVCEGPVWRPGIAGGRRAALPMELTVSF